MIFVMRTTNTVTRDVLQENFSLFVTERGRDGRKEELRKQSTQKGGDGTE